jgi:L-ascorbate metabolism protein UlaG (beta-lactamase superfamily)
MPRKTTETQGLTIEWLDHSSIGIYGKKIIYIDPFSEVLKGDEKKADLIISTHGHRDHFDIDAINTLSKENTYVIIKSGCEKRDLASNFIKELDISEIYTVDEIEIRAVHAYNTKRFRSPGTPFHPEGFGMGVIITAEGVKLYYAGDTDFIEPMERLRDEKIDVAFLPIGGTYTMDLDEAVQAVIAIEPRIAIPVHYNYIEGTQADPMEFKEKVENKSETRVTIL